MWNRSGDARAVPNRREQLGQVDLCGQVRARGTGRLLPGVRLRQRVLPVVTPVLAGLGVILALISLDGLNSPARAAIAAMPAAEPAIAGEGIEANYLRALHAQIHPLWAGLYVRAVVDKLPPGSPATDGNRQAVVLFSLRWDGSPTNVIVVGESGVKHFDQAARDAILRADRFPVPPVALFSDDGLAHFRWVLARDGRLCSGGELHRFEDPLEEALPHLLIQGRVEEALWRVVRRSTGPAPGRAAVDGQDSAPPGTGSPSLSPAVSPSPPPHASGQVLVAAPLEEEDIADPLALFAREWLRRPQADPVADAWAAAALARTGDERQIPRLRVALQRSDTVAAAALALNGLKVEICPLVQGALGASDPSTRDIAVAALRAAGAHLPPTSPCVQVLGAMVLDQALNGQQRALAARALAATSTDGGRALLSSVLTDPSPAVRATALSLLARPGGGRAVLYRWLPFLRDPSVVVRAAAAAALIRSCGDLALDQLVLVWKEPGPEVGVAVANELGRMTSGASEAFLVRLAKRRDPDVHAAAVQAQTLRHDLTARAATSARARIAAGEPPSTPASPAMQAVSNLDRRDAAVWVLAHYDTIDRADLIKVFASWLAESPRRRPDSLSAR